MVEHFYPFDEEILTVSIHLQTQREGAADSAVDGLRGAAVRVEGQQHRQPREETGGVGRGRRPAAVRPGRGQRGHREADGRGREGMAQQKILLKQYQEAEMESRERQEFLQAEKMTLSETLKVREIITQEERQVVTFNDFNVVSHALLRAHRLARGPSRCPAVRRSPASIRANNGPDDIINRLLHFLAMDAQYD